MPQPLARQQNLILRELSDEMLVYDSKSDKAHCLNRTSALVWKYCDGHNTVKEITRLLTKELNVPIKDDLVWLALQQLDRNQLLEEGLERPIGMEHLSRRKLLRKYLPATLALPVIISLTAPAAQAQGSCLPPFASCNPPFTPCCPPNTCFNSGDGPICQVVIP